MTRRDTTRAFNLVLAAQEHLDAMNRKLVEAAHILRAIDARESRLEPHLRKSKNPLRRTARVRER